MDFSIAHALAKVMLANVLQAEKWRKKSALPLALFMTRPALSCILTISMGMSAHQPGGRWESTGSRAASSRLKLPEASQFKAYPEAYYTGVSTLSQTRPVQSRAAGTPSWPKTWPKNNGCDFKSRNFGVMCHGAVSMYYNFLPLAKVFSLHDFLNFFKILFCFLKK